MCFSQDFDLTQFIDKISSNKYKNIRGNKLYTINNKYNTDYVKMMIDIYLLQYRTRKSCPKFVCKFANFANFARIL